MTYFTNCKTLDELKAEYRRLAKENHPDHGGDTAAMQRINDEYRAMFELLKNKHNATADEYHKTTEAPDEFIDIINALLHLGGLEVELCGSWLWIGGDTRPVKDQLKAVGCRWSSNKKLWYWRHPEDSRPYHRGIRTMGEIRNKYGSQLFSGDRETSRCTALQAAV